jgi:hypothetical protein
MQVRRGRCGTLLRWDTVTYNTTRGNSWDEQRNLQELFVFHLGALSVWSFFLFPNIFCFTTSPVLLEPAPV